jgi:DNA-binding transcriptional MerR regulator
MRDPVQRNVPPRPGGGEEPAGSGRRAEPSGATGTMSIGEVLGILKPEFPDITVSKIRFLEGAGLVQPDRSASGYRKFSEDDVSRLRFVLRAQRDQYLPLRVIRQRLADLEQSGGLAPGSVGGSPGAGGSGAGGAPAAEASGATTGGSGAGAPSIGAGGSPGVGGGAAVSPGTGVPGGGSAAGSTGVAAPGDGTAGAGGAAGSLGTGTADRGGAGPAGAGGPGTNAARAAGAAGVGQPGRVGAGVFGAAPPSDAQFTRDELCRAAGATVDQLMELESFGLVSARGSGERGAWYGGDDLVLLRLSRELADYGLEARHLRMYKLFAEREAALFEQVVAPLVRQRNPEARARARDTIDALAQLGGRMRDLALRSAVQGLAETRDPHR